MILLFHTYMLVAQTTPDEDGTKRLERLLGVMYELLLIRHGI